MAVTPEAEQQANRDALDQARRNLGIVLRAGYGTQPTAQTLAKVGLVVVNNVKRIIRSSPAGGRQYGRRGPGRPPHRASAPGEPPASDTGRLMSSYTFQVGFGYVDVGTNVQYAKWLEFGTSKMRPRPHFRPGIEQARGMIAAQVVADVTRNQQAAIASLRSAGRLVL